MELKDAIPIVAVAVTAIVGLVAYTYQRWLDRKNALIELRRKAYQEVLVALQKHLHEASPQTLTELSMARARVFVVASDATAKELGNFFGLAVRNDSTPAPEGRSILEAYAKMVLEMRRDCFERSTLTLDEAVKASPVEWRENDAPNARQL